MIVSYWTLPGSQRGGLTRPWLVRRCSVLMASAPRTTSQVIGYTGSLLGSGPRRCEGRMSDWKPRMQKTVRHLAEQLTGIRPGTLSIGFVETFRVAVGGNSVAVGKLAAVTGQGDRIVITPFDPA